MTQLKSKILAHIASTDISGRYRTAIAVSLANPNYEKLYYHNEQHIKSVLNLFEVFRKMAGKSFKKEHLEAAYLAAVFHDAGHSGHPDTHVSEDGLMNVPRAVYQFTRWAMDQKLDDMLMSETALLIWSTEYPEREDSLIQAMTAEQREVSDMLRDADMLWGTMPENADACMLGMYAERREAGLKVPTLEDGVKPDTKEILVGQIRFVQSYIPLTNSGRSFKNAMFQDACARWAESTLNLDRQMMWADDVSKMDEAQVLQLASALQSAKRGGRSAYP